LTSASRFSTGEDHLRAELQQVGLPREHAAALAKVYHDNADSIRKNLIQDSLMSEYDAFCYTAILIFYLLKNKLRCQMLPKNWKRALN
jgi:hypothetical protein